MLSLRRASLASAVLARRRTARNPSAHLPPHYSSSSSTTNSWLSSLGKPLLPWPPPDLRHSPNLPRPPQLDAATTPPAVEAGESPPDDYSAFEGDAATVARVLAGPFSEPSDLDAALEATGLPPSPPLLQAVLQTSELSPTPALALFRWARARPGFLPTPPLLTSLVDLLGKSRSFDAAWSVLLADGPGAVTPTDAYVALIRRYARAGMPRAAIRTYEYMVLRGSCRGPPADDAGADPFDLLVDALCKEDHTRAASEYLDQRKAAEPGWCPAVRSYNILLNGWFRCRKLRRAQRVWDEMRRQEGIHPTVVTYGTMIEGLCRMRRVDQAMALLEEMVTAGIHPNEITCNPIVDALAEAGRFREALGAVERFPLYGISPNTSTYNSLVKGFCKKGELVGASKALRAMIGRGLLPTPTTYNYFFRFFARWGKMEEGMSLYTKMIQSGYSPDRLTYHLLIKMLCDGRRLDLAAQVIREMHGRGLHGDLATGSMLVHLLCRLRRLDEACEELEGMVRKGIAPQYLTCRMLVGELERLGRAEAAARVAALMASVPHSTKLPNTYRGEKAADVRRSVVRKAQAMSEALKASRDNNNKKKKKKKKKGAAELQSSTEDAVDTANKLISDIKRRVYAVC